jgi:aminopeptidase N
MVIPLKVALIGEASGGELVAEQVVQLTEAEQTVEFSASEPAYLSINRHFSAPVIVEAERRPGELEALAVADTDSFARYEALQELMLRELLVGIQGGEVRAEPVIAAVRSTLQSNALDPAFKADAILLPSETLLSERLDVSDPAGVHEVRDGLRRSIGQALGRELLDHYQASSAADPESRSGADKGLRRLRAATLGYLAAGDPAQASALAKQQFDAAQTMTERQSALAVLAMLGGPEAEAALSAFYKRFKDDALVIDKWFGVQAAANNHDTIDVVERLARHPDFTLANPNRLRSLIGTYASTPFAFHREDGRGYDLMARMIGEADAINPQTAARFVPPLGRWRKVEPGRAALMREALERILAAPGLSKDVFEQASKSLG